MRTIGPFIAWPLRRSAPPEHPYRYVISVGYNCGAAYQIRLHTGLREAYFFDWLYSPIDAVAKVVNSNFRDLFLRERIEINREGREVVDLHYGLRLNHSFKVNGVGLVLPELVERNLRAERDKFNFMAGKFVSALRSDERCAFIRYNPFPHKPDSDASIDKLHSALMKQAGNRYTSLIVVQNSVDVPSTTTDRNLVIMKINEIPARSTSYHGRDFILTDDVAWSEVFASLPINLVGRKSRRT